MRHPLAPLLALLFLLAHPATAEGNRTGVFDYYVLALSWSPNWCLREGDQRNSEQCEGGSGHGWILHGLWPQHNVGYPAYCQTAERPPNRRMTAEMADIMGTSGLAWHQWKKHGSCTGLPATDYFALSREAYRGIIRPKVFRKLTRDVRLPAKVVEEAFLQSNRRLKDEMLTVTCKHGQIQEVRICLTKTLQPRPCTAGVSRDCTLQDALFTPLR